MNKQDLLKQLTSLTVAQLRENPTGFNYQGFSKGVLSNWHPSETILTLDGVKVKMCCVEKYYMVRKAQFFEDQRTLAALLNSHEPLRIRELGSKISNFQEPLWAKNSGNFMFEAVLAKYIENPHMAKTLLDTGDDVLVYYNSADKNWGAGIDMMDPRLSSPFEWPGENRLGFIQMMVREALVRMQQAQE